MARVTSPVFIGRLEELTLLDGALTDVVGEKGRVVLLGGEAGVGKTRLAREALRRAGDEVLAMTGASIGVGGSMVPFAPFTDALRRLLRQTERPRWPALLGWTRTELAALLPEIADGRTDARPADAEATGQGRLFAAILGLLDRLGRDRPTILLLEDIHWADRSTLDLIAYLAHALDRERVLLLMTFRTDELATRSALRQLMARLERLDRVERIDLAPLQAREVAQLMQAIQGRRPTGPVLDEVVSRSQGNAFFVEELLAAQADGIGVPRALRELLELRLETVPRRARRLLDVAAVAGGPVDEALLRQVSGFTRSVVGSALHDALDQGLLVPSEPRTGGIEFRHALMAETVRARMLIAERQDLHRAIAEWLEGQAEVDARDVELAGRIAHHWDAASEHARAMPWLVRAGAAAEATYAWAEAERHYERVLALLDEFPDARIDSDRADIAGRAAEAAFESGHYERAARLGRTAVSLIDSIAEPARAARQYARLTHYLMWTREIEDGSSAADRAVALVADGPPTREQGEALAWRAAMHVFALRYEPAGDDAAAALAIAREVGDSVTQGRALCVLGIAQAEMGHLEEGRQSLEEYRRIAIEADRPHDAARADFNLAAVLVDARRFEEALAVSRRAVEQAQRTGMDRAMGDATQYWVAYCLMALERLPEADAVMRDLLLTTRDPRQRSEAIALHGWIVLRSGGSDEAEAMLAEPWILADHHRSDTARYLLACAELAFIRGRYEAAAMVAARARTELDPNHLHVPLAALSVMGLVASAAARRPTTEIEAFAADLRAVVGRCRRHQAACHAVTPIWAKLGEVESDRLAGRSTPRRWRATLEGLRTIPEPYWRAYAGYRLAEVIVPTGAGRDGATALLADARALAVALNAEQLVADIDGLVRRARLQAAGLAALAPMQMDARESREAASRDPFALTPREAEVLVCLAQGLSDAEIADRLTMAKATASVHVMNIKQKLGAGSRVELVVRAINEGLVDVAVR